MVKHLLSLSDLEWQAWFGDEDRTLDRALQKVADSFTEAYRNRPDRKIFTRDMVKAAYYYPAESKSSKKGDTSISDNSESM